MYIIRNRQVHMNAVFTKDTDVSFSEFVKKLKEIGYDGVIKIESKITREQQIKDIKEAKIYLEELI